MIGRLRYYNNSSTDLQGIGGNEACTLSWEESASGPPHSLTWSVVCKSKWGDLCFSNVVVDISTYSPRQTLWIGVSISENGGERGSGAADARSTRNPGLTEKDGDDGDKHRGAGQDNTHYPI